MGTLWTEPMDEELVALLREVSDTLGEGAVGKATERAVFEFKRRMVAYVRGTVDLDDEPQFEKLLKAELRRLLTKH